MRVTLIIKIHINDSQLLYTNVNRIKRYNNLVKWQLRLERSRHSCNGAMTY